MDYTNDYFEKQSTKIDEMLNKLFDEALNSGKHTVTDPRVEPSDAYIYRPNIDMVFDEPLEEIRTYPKLYKDLEGAIIYDFEITDGWIHDIAQEYCICYLQGFHRPGAVYRIVGVPIYEPVIDYNTYNRITGDNRYCYEKGEFFYTVKEN